jgi:hypothetical protein
LWVDALRSGRFRQGIGKLTTVTDGATGESEERHCCLGVLCELALEAGVGLNVTERATPSTYAGLRRTRSYDGQVNFPPKEVLDWAGLTERNPSVRHHAVVRTLGFLNDERNLTFAAIADLVEEQL